MARKVAYGKKRYKARIGWKGWGVGLSAEYSQPITLRDGLDAANVPALSSGSVGFELLAGTADFLNTRRGLKGRLDSLELTGQFHIDNDNAGQTAMEFMTWVMAAPSSVVSDWQLNNRDPNDAGNDITASANPYIILSKPKLTRVQTEESSSAHDIQSWQARFSHVVKRGVRIPYPWQVYLFFRSQASYGNNLPSAGHVLYSHNFRMRLRRAAGGDT